MGGGVQARVCIAIGLSLFPMLLLGKERVAGAERVERAGDVASILFELAAEKLERKELDLFLKSADSVLDWSEANGQRWREADAAERPLDVIRSFEVWAVVEASGSEFVATLAKLMFLREFSAAPEELKSLKSEVRQMEAVVSENKLSDFVLERAEEEIAEKRRMIDLLEGKVPRNLRLYKAMQERIDPVLDRFESIGR